MSTGGIFQLITNDGKQDRMLMATSLLNKRLKEIEKIRASNPQIRDATPTLVDIERTHIFFLNAHFKPFVAIGYEYMITQPEVGLPAFGNELQFAIPQFGDFFHDMMIHVVLTDLHPVDQDEYLADPPGPPENANLPLVSNKVRYCEYPGERLLQQVSFEINGNPLDQYGPDDVVFHRLFKVTPEKQPGWDRNMGQQVPNVGYLYHNPGSENFAEMKFFTSGAQTWKSTQDRLELWIPLLFWFNLDPSLSIPSVSIPYGQRFITVRLATADQLCECRTYSDVSTAFVPPTFDKFELYINNIFVNPEIHDIFIKRIGFTMIRVHLNQSIRVDRPKNTILLYKFKYPVETIFTGLRPEDNDTNLQDWHLFSQVTRHSKTIPVAYPPIALLPDVPSLGFSAAEWRECESQLQTIGVEAHGVMLYDEYPTGFYNSYIPFTKGGHNIQTPIDCGAVMIPFNLYPNSYQPSGHVNVSRAREMYINFDSPTIAEDNRATLITTGLAINFLLVADGTATLRYST